MNSLPPGRELDALIAEKVFGHTVLSITRAEAIESLNAEADPLSDIAARVHLITSLVNGVCLSNMGEIKLPHYSTNISAAWQAVDKLIEGGHHIDIAFYQKMGLNVDGPPYEAHWKVTGPYRYDIKAAISSSAPHAICLAALKAVGHE